MTRRARSQNLRVIDPDDRCPGYRAVAILTYIGCLSVRRRFTGRIGAVVATETVARDADVIEIGRYPADGRVTVVAIVAAGNMCRVLASGDRTVVAG